MAAAGSVGVKAPENWVQSSASLDMSLNSVGMTTNGAGMV